MGVHESHCCIVHGCKYCDHDCPVANRQTTQLYSCEDCQTALTGVQHEVKIDTALFEALENRTRVHDVRRGHTELTRVGDVMVYTEYDFNSKRPLKRELRRVVTAVTSSGEEGLPDNISVVSLGD